MHFNIPEDRASLLFPSFHAAQCFIGKLKNSTTWKFSAAADGRSYRVEMRDARILIAFRNSGRSLEMKLRNEAYGVPLHYEDWNLITESANRYRT